MWQFVQGSTFSVGGAFQLDGDPVDMTGWSIVAQVHDASGVKLIADLTATWLDPTKGAIQLSASDTSGWTPGKARIDVAVRDFNGNQYVSQPDFFRIIDTPLPL